MIYFKTNDEQNNKKIIKIEIKIKILHAKPPQKPRKSSSGIDGICDLVVVAISRISIPAASNIFISTRATTP